jgi:hypothetical protein
MRSKVLETGGKAFFLSVFPFNVVKRRIKVLIIFGLGEECCLIWSPILEPSNHHK